MEKSKRISSPDITVSPLGDVSADSQFDRVVGSIKKGRVEIQMMVEGKLLRFEFEQLGPGIWTSMNLDTGKMKIKG